MHLKPIDSRPLVTSDGIQSGVAVASAADPGAGSTGAYVQVKLAQPFWCQLNSQRNRLVLRRAARAISASDTTRRGGAAGLGWRGVALLADEETDRADIVLAP